MRDNSLKVIQRDFWQAFANKLSQHPETPLYVDSEHIEDPKSHLPQRQNLPSDSVHYVFVTNTVQDYIGVKIQIEDEGHKIFTQLEHRKDEIGSEISPALEWSTGQAWDKIILKRKGNIKTDREQWDEYQNWLIKYGEKFDTIFTKHLQAIDI